MEYEINLSPHLACKLCRNNLSDVCGTCLQDSQFPWFEARRNLTLDDLPRFPLQDFNNGMPVKMRQIVIGIYMDIIVRTLQEMR